MRLAPHLPILQTSPRGVPILAATIYFKFIWAECPRTRPKKSCQTVKATQANSDPFEKKIANYLIRIRCIILSGTTNDLIRDLN